MQWLVDHSWTLWLIAAVLLAVCELATVDLMFLMAAVGAIVGGIVAGTAGGLILPVIAFALATLVLFAVLRPWLLKRWGGAMRFEVSRYIGHETTAASEIALDHPGKVMIEGVPWTARPWEPADVIEPGTNIVVVAIKGKVAYVHKALPKPQRRDEGETGGDDFSGGSFDTRV